jgi:hypothetical protein
MCSGDFNDLRRLPIAVVDHGFESFHSLFFKPLVIHHEQPHCFGCLPLLVLPKVTMPDPHIRHSSPQIFISAILPLLPKLSLSSLRIL